MDNKELLLAISDMMDQKLDAINVKMDILANKLSAEIRAVDDRLSSEIKKINISLENIVIPRINHIEQCYLDTSERYINETGRINGLAADVQVIKSIVQTHSEQLRKTS